MQLLVLLSALCAVTYGGVVPKLDGRIVGGKQVEIEEYPHQASVRIYDQHICGGSIIDESTILTACHCVYDMDHSRFSVRVGATKHREGQLVTVHRVIQHRNYNPDTSDYDIAILILSEPLIKSNKIHKIDLQNHLEVPKGTTAIVSGWGVTSSGSSTVPESLRAVDVDVITNDDCNNKYPRKITDRMMCAQTLNHDSCQGDSGGPLVANNKLIGVVSWGYGCADRRYPGVYAKVSNLRDWIMANM